MYYQYHKQDKQCMYLKVLEDDIVGEDVDSQLFITYRW